MADVRLTVTGDTKLLEREIKKALKSGYQLGSLNTRGFSQPLGKIKGQLGEFEKSLEASNARVIAFTASAGILMGVTRAFQEMARATIEVEKSLKDINVIMGASSRSLQKFGNDLFNVAKQTGQSFLTNILQKGGSLPAMALFRSFRGREPSIQPLLRHSGIVIENTTGLTKP